MIINNSKQKKQGEAGEKEAGEGEEEKIEKEGSGRAKVLTCICYSDLDGNILAWLDGRSRYNQLRVFNSLSKKKKKRKEIKILIGKRI